MLKAILPWLKKRWWLLALPLAVGGAVATFQALRPLPPPTPGKHPLVVVTHIGPLSYEQDAQEVSSGFEHDLVVEFAKAQGLEVKFIAVPPADVTTYLQKGRAHLAAAWLTPWEGMPFKASASFMETDDVIVQNEAALNIDNIKKLKGRTVHVIPNSRQASNLKESFTQAGEIAINPFIKGVELDLLQAIAKGDVEVALIDRALFKIGLNFYPNLQGGTLVGKPKPITWIFPPNADSKFIDDAESFIKQSRKNGFIKRLEDRYLGHVTRLNQADTLRFITSISTILPKYRKLFQAAQTTTGIDWRLIAALAYQESQWEPLATSPTGVRGIMMLTEETADRLGVKNRLDPKEAIAAGARYFSYLRTAITATAMDPDSYWLALAAYNVGPGHFNAARSIARQLKKNPDSWYEMKSVLPLLAQPQFYENLLSGKGRGGEAVLMAENVRMFYDILSRHEPPFVSPTKMSEGMAGMGSMSGMGGMAGMSGMGAPLGKATSGSSLGLKNSGSAGLLKGSEPGLKLK